MHVTCTSYSHVILTLLDLLRDRTPYGIVAHLALGAMSDDKTLLYYRKTSYMVASERLSSQWADVWSFRGLYDAALDTGDYDRQDDGGLEPKKSSVDVVSR